jgi:hypothetical protein
MKQYREKYGYIKFNNGLYVIKIYNSIKIPIG